MIAIIIWFGVLLFSSGKTLAKDLMPVCDIENASSVGQITVRNDKSNVLEDVSVRILVLRNDYAPAGIDSQSLQLHERLPDHGSVELLQGYIIYTPEHNFFGRDTFQYRICDLNGNCGTAMVSLHVLPANDSPVAMDDTFVMPEDSSMEMHVLANDSDWWDRTLMSELKISFTKRPGHGKVKVTDDQKVIYSPDPDYFGGDYFQYSACEIDGGTVLCDTATVRITVQPRNDPPVAADDHVTTYQGLLVVIQVLANDQDTLDRNLDLEGSTISKDGLLQPQHGDIFIDHQVGMIIYDPHPGYTGMDYFEYRICDRDSSNVLCDTAKVSIAIDQVFSDSALPMEGQFRSEE